MDTQFPILWVILLKRQGRIINCLLCSSSMGIYEGHKFLKEFSLCALHVRDPLLTI